MRRRHRHGAWISSVSFNASRRRGRPHHAPPPGSIPRRRERSRAGAANVRPGGARAGAAATRQATFHPGAGACLHRAHLRSVLAARSRHVVRGEPHELRVVQILPCARGCSRSSNAPCGARTEARARVGPSESRAACMVDRLVQVVVVHVADGDVQLPVSFGPSSPVATQVVREIVVLRQYAATSRSISPVTGSQIGAGSRPTHGADTASQIAHCPPERLLGPTVRRTRSRPRWCNPCCRPRSGGWAAPRAATRGRRSTRSRPRNVHELVVAEVHGVGAPAPRAAEHVG